MPAAKPVVHENQSAMDAALIRMERAAVIMSTAALVITSVAMKDALRKMAVLLLVLTSICLLSIMYRKWVWLELTMVN